MKINWKVRLKNPVWWVQVVIAIITPVLAYFGLTAESMNSWEMVGDTVLRAIQNPYVIGLSIVSFINTLNDPTTKGICDSSDALKYEKPK